MSRGIKNSIPSQPLPIGLAHPPLGSQGGVYYFEMQSNQPYIIWTKLLSVDSHTFFMRSAF